MPIQLFDRDQIAVSYGDDDMERGWTRRASRNVREKLLEWARRVDDKIQGYTLLHVGIVHWTLLTIWVMLLVKVASVYGRMYKRSALFTTLCTNAVLFGTSDILAQCILQYTWDPVDPTPAALDATAHNLVSRYALFGDQDSDAENDSISLYNEYGPGATAQSPVPYHQSAQHPPRFDFFRWLCFMAWGSFLSFFQVPWYKVLNFFYTEDPTVVQVLERVLSDQLVYSPISLYCFFMYSNYIMQKGDSASFKVKIQKVYLGTLGCNYLVWPPVQFINFLVVPKHLQVPFSSSVGVVWNCFLSMRNASHSVD